jgi:hypothetical protein
MASVEDLEWMIPLTCGHRAQIPGPRLEERLRALYCTGCWAFVTPASANGRHAPVQSAARYPLTLLLGDERGRRRTRIGATPWSRSTSAQVSPSTFEGTAAFSAARRSANTRPIRAAESGFVDFLWRFSPGASSRRTSSARASMRRRSISDGRSPSGSGRDTAVGFGQISHAQRVRPTGSAARAPNAGLPSAVSRCRRRCDSCRWAHRAASPALITPGSADLTDMGRHDQPRSSPAPTSHADERANLAVREYRRSAILGLWFPKRSQPGLCSARRGKELGCRRRSWLPGRASRRA